MDGDNKKQEMGESSLSSVNSQRSNNAQTTEKSPASDWRLVKLEEVQTKYENLQKEWDDQQEHLGRLQVEVYRLRNQLQTQSSFCASLGSIMGNLVWKASRLQPVVELLLTTNKLSEFFCVVSGTLVSFLETYGREMPDVRSDETQFILAMGGIVANIAAIAEGRHFIVTDSNGKELLQQILRLLPAIPNTSGDPLKRILLMVLYNVSLNQNGMLIMQDQKPLLTALSQTILCERTPELRLMALRLFESITVDIPNQTVLNQIQYFVPMQKMNSLQDTGDAEVRQYATNILSHLEKAERLVGHKFRSAPPYMSPSECSFVKNNTYI